MALFLRLACAAGRHSATTGGRIFTQNVRHHPMSDVLVQQAW